MRRVAALLVLLLLGAALVGPAAASPQPTPVCRFCGGQFEAAAADVGVNATVAGSDVRVEVDAAGTATWVVQLTLSTGSDAFEASPGQLEATARSLVENGYGLPSQSTFVSADLDGDRVTLRYRETDAAERHAGLLVVDTLHDRGGEPRYQVNADRFVIAGPSGTVVANDPESGEVTDGAVVWTGDGTAGPFSGRSLEGSPYVVFGPDRSPGTRLRATIAVAMATAPIIIQSVRQFVLVQTVLFVVLLGGVVAAFRRRRPRPRIGPLAGLLGVAGTLAVVTIIAWRGAVWLAGPPLFAIGLAAMAGHPASRRRLRQPRHQAIGVGALLLATYLVLLGVYLLEGNRWLDPTVAAFRATALALPIATMVPLGGSLAGRSVSIRPWFALVVMAFLAVPVAGLNLADPPTGLGAGVVTFGLLLAAVAMPLVGSLGLGLGWSLAGGPAPPTR